MLPIDMCYAPAMSRMPDPWSVLRARPDLRLHWKRLPRPLLGASTQEEIWLDPELTQRERRCVLAHELVHIWQGHNGHQPPAVERRVHEATARWLLPDLTIVARALADSTLADAAEALWVTEGTLTTRLSSLTSAERAHLERHHLAFPIGA